MILFNRHKIQYIDMEVFAEYVRAYKLYQASYFLMLVHLGRQLSKGGIRSFAGGHMGI